MDSSLQYQISCPCVPLFLSWGTWSLSQEYVHTLTHPVIQCVQFGNASQLRPHLWIEGRTRSTQWKPTKHGQTYTHRPVWRFKSSTLEVWGSSDKHKAIMLLKCQIFCLTLLTFIIASSVHSSEDTGFYIV